MKKLNFKLSPAILAILCCTLFLLSSCTAETHEITKCLPESSKGFWWGLWHGIISPITFIVSLFNDNVSIYETNNNGGWYNFGFILGIGFSFGGGSRSSK